MPWRIGCLAVVAVMVVGCSASGAETPAVGSSGPEPTPTTAPASPANPSSPPSPTPTASAASASAASEPWDLLWISDSTDSGGTPWLYADRIEQDLGVTVRVTDAWTPGLSAFMVLDTLRGRNDYTLVAYSGAVNLPEAIREAEVIVVTGNPASSRSKDAVQCAAAYDPKPSCSPLPSTCTRETFAQYEADLVAIFDEVFRIREGRPVILRTHDWYLPWGPVKTWAACDCLEVCLECSRQVSDAIHRAAASRRVPVADYLATFSGPDRDQPLPSPWIFDGVHPTAEGTAELARVMIELGYEPVAPPGQ